MQGNVQDTDPSQHSPWELFDDGVSPEHMRAEAPSLEAGESQRLQAALKQLMRTAQVPALLRHSRTRKLSMLQATEVRPCAHADALGGPLTPLLQLPMWHPSLCQHAR